MKEINTTITEQALHMYKETVSPKQESLEAILSQLPEKKINSVQQAIRSPYRWLSITQAVVLCSVILMMYPTLTGPSYIDDPFYTIDQEVDTFDAGINQEDYERSLLDDAL